ncbi:GNAT family N-acetyltransferase [Undibacterium sp. Di27W]|uniref:GNAT family N-acetyltransferase n=1 Tax=Undibacterium sp. Di27W TaxID=3413036 RepID=UPI003BF1143A
MMPADQHQTANEFAASAEKFAQIHTATAQARLICNVHAEMDVLRLDDLVLPVTVNSGQYKDAWVCSPLTTYWRYAQEEVSRYTHVVGRFLFLSICHVYGYLLRFSGIDRAVTINNWALSTNIYPALQDKAALRQAIASARDKWPGHGIWLRSLTQELNADWLLALREHGFMLIPSRQVYLFDDLANSVKQHANLQRDMHLLKATTLSRVSDSDIQPHDYARIAELYKQLYLDKYSRLNPEYTADFMQAWHTAGLLHFYGFKSADGVLQAIVGLFQLQGVVTAPIVGYNTALPRELGLYRLLMAAVFEHAMKHKLIVNLSAGAAHFKRLRGGKAAIEYSAVWAAHLPLRTRAAITCLSWLTTRIGIPVMKKYQL